MRLMASLLLATLPFTAAAQGFDARPLAPNQPTAIIIPDTAPAPAVQAPAPPAPPVEFGRFKGIQMAEPTLESLMRTRSVSLSREDARVLGQDRWTYAAYEPGGQAPKPNRAIVAFVPPGIDPTSALQTIDLRAYARATGWRILVLPMPQTARVQSGTLAEIAQARASSANDSQRIDRILSSVLSQEGAPASPAIIAMEGAGDGLLSLLCARTGRGPAPSHAVVLGGALDARAAAACQPNRVPRLLIARSTADTGTPYGGGEQPTLPGQPQAQSSTVLSAAGTRGLWAALARCRQTEPTLSWLPTTSSGRTALETHANCSAGGPVALMSAIDGASIPTGEDLVDIVAAFLSGEIV